MINLIFWSIFFSFGYVAGSYMRGVVFDRQAWRIYRWDLKVFGYRPVPIGAKLYNGDKILMGMEVDTHGFPDGGIKYE